MMVVMAMCLLSPLTSLAQLDARAVARAQQRGEDIGLGSANPFDTSDEDEQQTQDSTRKRRIRKPL